MGSSVSRQSEKANEYSEKCKGLIEMCKDHVDAGNLKKFKDSLSKLSKSANKEYYHEKESQSYQFYDSTVNHLSTYLSTVLLHVVEARDDDLTFVSAVMERFTEKQQPYLNYTYSKCYEVAMDLGHTKTAKLIYENLKIVVDGSENHSLSECPHLLSSVITKYSHYHNSFLEHCMIMRSKADVPRRIRCFKIIMEHINKFPLKFISSTKRTTILGFLLHNSSNKSFVLGCLEILKECSYDFSEKIYTGRKSNSFKFTKHSGFALEVISTRKSDWSDVIKFLYENGAPITTETMQNTLKTGITENIQALIDCGATLPPNDSFPINVIDYLYQNKLVGDEYINDKFFKKCLDEKDYKAFEEYSHLSTKETLQKLLKKRSKLSHTKFFDLVEKMVE